MAMVALWLVVLTTFLSAGACGLLLRWARRRQWVDHPDGPDGRKHHATPTPNVGGIGITLAILIPMALAACLAWQAPRLAPWLARQDWSTAYATHLPGLAAQLPALLLTIGAILVIHLLGVVDDRLRLRPWPKLLVQVAVAGLLAGLADMRVLQVLDIWGPAGYLASLILSVLWITAIINALNFMDNMDGLSAGVGMLCGVMYLAAALINGQWFVAGFAALVVGSLLGFLIYNFPPARMFMGDGGSLVLGLALALLSIRTTYVHTDHASTSARWYALLTPLVILAVPLYDLVSVTLIRLAQGKSPLVGDRNHFSHRLLRKGLSTRAAVLVIYLTTVVTGLGGIMLQQLTPWQAGLVAGQTLAALLLLALLEGTTPNRHDPGAR